MANILELDRRAYLKRILVLTGFGISFGSIITYFSCRNYLSKKECSNILNQKKTLIADLTETIIPRTMSPGAIDAGVSNYIILVVENCFNEDDQREFIGGLTDFENFCQSINHKKFSSCTYEEKYSVVAAFSNKSIYSSRIITKIRNKIFGKPFYLKFRELTVEGYCLSKLGATRGLNYDFIPGNYIGCLPIQKKQLSWATK